MSADPCCRDSLSNDTLFGVPLTGGSRDVDGERAVSALRTEISGSELVRRLREGRPPPGVLLLLLPREKLGPGIALMSEARVSGRSERLDSVMPGPPETIHRVSIYDLRREGRRKKHTRCIQVTIGGVSPRKGNGAVRSARG